MLDFQQLRTNLSPEGTCKNGHRSKLPVLNLTCEMSIFSGLSPAYRGWGQPQAGLKSKHKGARVRGFKEKYFYYFLKYLTMSLCETLRTHRCPSLLFHGLGELHLPRHEQLFQTESPGPVAGQESSGRHGRSRQWERRALGRGGHSLPPHPLPLQPGVGRI